MDDDSMNIRHLKEATSLDDLLTNSAEADSFKLHSRLSSRAGNSMADNNSNLMNSTNSAHQALDTGYNHAPPQMNSSMPPRGLQQLLSSNQTSMPSQVSSYAINRSRFVPNQQTGSAMLVEGPQSSNAVTGSSFSSTVINRSRPPMDNGTNQIYKQVSLPNRYLVSGNNSAAYVVNPQLSGNNSGQTATICLPNPNGLYGSNQQHINGQFPGGTMSNQQNLLGSGSRVIPNTGNPGGQMVNPSIQPQINVQSSNYLPTSNQLPVGQTNAGGFCFDPHKKSLIQRQLILLLHATKCRKSDNNSSEPCETPHCPTMRTVLVHMSGCAEGKNCSVPHCASSKQIISHWRSCTDRRCTVCEPLRKQINTSSSGGANYSSSVTTTTSALSQAPVSQNSNQILSSSFAPSDNSTVNGINGASINSNNSIDTRSDGSMTQNLSESATNPVDPESDWRSSVSKGQRQHLVRRIVQTIFPTPDKSAYGDDRMSSLIEYAQKVENENYQNARNREEYFHKLAERCYKINKELEEKKKLRNSRTTSSGGFELSSLSGLGNDASHDNSNSDLNSIDRLDAQMSSNVSSSRNGISSGILLDSISTDTHATTSSLSSAAMNRSDTSDAFSANPTSSMSSNRGNDVQVNANMSEQDNLAASQFDHALKHEYNKRQSDSVTTEAPEVKKEPVTPFVKREVPTPSTTSVKSESLTNDDSSLMGGFPLSSIGSAGRTSSDLQMNKGTKNYPHFKKWSREELCRNLLALHRLISAQEEALPFLEPVDPIALGIPDYSKIVKNPMDLGTIQKKLEDGVYQDPWEVIDDFWLMFANAWLYNKKNSRVYRFCSKLAETFEKHVDKYMQSMGLCCGQDYIFQPQVLYCSTPNMCTINRDANYYYYEKRNVKDLLFPEKYYVCEKCYGEAAYDIFVYVDANQPLVKMEKDLFQPRKNNVKEPENFVNCCECGRKWHQICALHMDEIWRSGFVCRQCLTDRPRRRPENNYVSKRLATTKLGSFLEKRVNDFLKKKDSGAGEVTIRVLYSGDKSVEVKPMMKARFCDNGTLAEQFPYKSKAIFAFQEIDGVDVCFFGLHVQEYGSECPRPNQRRVYVAYLDSVFFFRPKQHRTDVYHEILVGYLQYARFLGYTMAHIWACPPSEGDDYIFHMHPPDQKIPKPKRLQEWYQKMLEKALIERIVTDYKDIFTDAMRNCIDSPAEIPYFEGDFWSNSLEDIIKEVDEIKAKQEEVNVKVEVSDEDDDELNDNDDTFTLGSSRRSNTNKKKPKKRKGNKRPGGGVPLKRKKIGTKTMQQREETDLLLNKVYDVMDKHKDVFFNIRLHPQQQEANLPPIEDPDPAMNSELMDGRDAFLAMSREKHLEFSSLRRAKFSTMVLLYELHTENRTTFVYTCNLCGCSLHIRWHCKTCQEFDLCEKCYSHEKHQHPLEKIQGIKLGAAENEEGSSNTDISVQEARRNSIERCIKSLTHACQCRDANCRQNACQKMKNVLVHMRSCDQKANGSCSLCKQLIALCCYHAKYCTDQTCNMPFCQNIKYRWKQQQLQQRLVQSQNLRRRIANMQMQRDPSGAQPNTTQHLPISAGNTESSSHQIINPSTHNTNIVNTNQVLQISQTPMPPVNANNVQHNAQVRAQQVPGHISHSAPQSRLSTTMNTNPGNSLVLNQGLQQSVPPRIIHHLETRMPHSANSFGGGNGQGYLNNSSASVNHPMQTATVHNITSGSNHLSSMTMSGATSSEDSTSESMRRTLQTKIASIRQETHIQHEQNQRLQEFLTSNPPYIEVFRKMREEHQRKRNMTSAAPLASHPQQNVANNAGMPQMTPIRQQAPNQWANYSMNSNPGVIRNDTAHYNTQAQPQPRIIVRSATKPTTNSFPPSK